MLICRRVALIALLAACPVAVQRPAQNPAAAEAVKARYQGFGRVPRGFTVAGYQQLVRGEPFRGRYRRSFEKPVAFQRCSSFAESPFEVSPCDVPAA
ncbi:MAG TPA: hypothetical protein VF332_10715 [Vicinamibacterales bacterium]